MDIPKYQQQSSQLTHLNLSDLISKSPQIVIVQKKSWLEIFTDLESSNRYQIFSPQAELAGRLIEQGHGFMRFLKRTFLGTHRPFDIAVVDNANARVLHFSRNFFWLFSDMFVHSPQGQKLGSAHRRFALFSKNYDLMDAKGQIFAHIKSPFWRFWTFKIFDTQGHEVAHIAKKWSGTLREVFTNADSFLIDFGAKSWTANERCVIFAAALSIDFDYFERRSNP